MTQESVFQPLFEELATGFLADNSLAAMSIRSREPLDPTQLIELSSQAKALASLATLVGRTLDRILDNHHLWAEVEETLRKALVVWSDVPADSDPALRLYLKQLERLCELAAYRVDLFSVTSRDREAFIRRYRSDFGEDRTAKPEQEERSEEHKRVDGFLSLPI